MCVGYRELLARRRGEITAEVTTAQPLTDGQRDTLVQELREAMGAKVTLDTQVDASLLGGMIVKIGSRMVDSSLRTKLQRLELSLKGAA
jgi:F-type H+-transporting ATPase subunit delta